MPRIPIEFNDEKVNGVLADIHKIKVIYRGYTPKNTFFFFKALTSKSYYSLIQYLSLIYSLSYVLIWILNSIVNLRVVTSRQRPENPKNNIGSI